MLNAEQKCAASDLDGTSIIIAGAGTGKTQTLIHKLVYLIQKGVDPSRICLLTFTNDAAATMKARAVSLGAANIEKLTACTYHSFCDRLMRQYNHIIGRSNDYLILEPSMVNDIVSMKLNEYKEDLRHNGIKPPTAKAVAAVFSTCINQDIPLREAVANNEKLTKACNYDDKRIEYLIQVLTMVRENVNEYKQMQNLKDFDDLLLGAHDLLNNDTVRGLVNYLYQYILIDEYQDTNHIQAEIVHLLRDTNNNLVVVGDDFQSIYKFRGAEVRNFTEFPDEFDNVTEHTLVQNYRSTQEILDLSNRVMEKHADFGFQKTLVTGKNKHGVKPTVYRPKDQKEECELVHALIRKYLKDEENNGMTNRKTAVLYRGSNSAIYLEGSLTKHGDAYEKHGGTAFFDMDCVQDVLSYLRVVANPFHELAWYRILRIYSHIGDKRAANMAAESKTMGFLKNVSYRQGSTKTAVAINGDLTWLEQILDLVQEQDTSYEMLKIVVKHYKEIYERRAENNESMEDRKDSTFDTLDALLDLANSPEYDDLGKWLGATTLREVDKPKEGDCNIVLSTVHSAKGLEWPHVIILDCVDGIFPRAESKEELDEELRCFYVAMTRAADTLDIICPKCVNVFGQLNRAQVTPFLMNLGSGYANMVYDKKNDDGNIKAVIDKCNSYADFYEKE